METWIAIVPNAISLKDIARVKKISEDKVKLKGEVDGVLRTDIRSSEICFLNPDDELWVYNIIGSIAQSANKHYNFSLSNIQDIQYTRYKAEVKGFYGWHFDSMLDDFMPDTDRKLSISVQLSNPDEYKGGNLEFRKDKLHKKYKEIGTAIVFPSFLEHRVTPVTKGERTSLVSWIEGEKFR